MNLLRTIVCICVLVISACAVHAQQTRSELYSPERFWQEYTTEDTAIMLDLRTPDEFAKGHIEGAINVDFYHNSFDKTVDTLKRDIPVYIYGSRGYRSYQAARVFGDKRFEEVYDLSGGFNRWVSEQMPVVE